MMHSCEFRGATSHGVIMATDPSSDGTMTQEVDELNSL